MVSTSTTLATNLLWGVRRGAGIACIYSAVAIILAFMQRSPEFPGYNANVFEIIALYLLGGTLGGAITGVLRPIGGSAVGGGVIGLIAGIPFFAGGLILFAGMPTVWHKQAWITLVILAMYGAVVGVWMGAKARAAERVTAEE